MRLEDNTRKIAGSIWTRTAKEQDRMEILKLKSS